MSQTLTKADLETAKNELVQAIKEAVAPLATKVELQEAVAPLATKVELQEAVAPLATKTELADKPGRAEFKELRDMVLRVISFVPERKQYAKLLADMDLLISLVLNLQVQVSVRQDVQRDVAMHRLRLERLEGQVTRCPDIAKGQ